MKVTIVGSGNLATNLSAALKSCGKVEFAQVYSRTEDNAKKLAENLGCDFTTNASQILPGSDLYIFSLKDSCLEEVLSQVPENDGLWVHTAGSVPMEVFKPYAKRYGVFYPLQTFSKQRIVDFSRIPIFIEACDGENLSILENLGLSISSDVRVLSSEKRRNIHLAAVFACNFTNHIYALAANILEDADIPFDVLLPLIDETVSKVHQIPPREAQTGPAVRYDENVINKHLNMLSDPMMNEIYRLLSQSIHKESTK